MISNIVVTPNVFDSKNNVSHIIGLLKDTLNNPIFFVDYEKANWIQIINTNYINNVDQRYKTKLQSLLILLDKEHKIIKQTNHGITIGRTTHWIDVSKKAIVKKLIDFVISDDEYAKKAKQYLANKCESINDITLEDTLWDKIKIKRSIVLRKSISEYKELFLYFLPYTSKLTIIDAYVEYSPKYEKFIELCSQLLGNRENLPTKKCKLVIHTSFNRDKNCNLENYLKNLNIKYGHEYKIHFWNDLKIVGDKIHDRFLFTESLGILMGHSSDIDITSNQKTTFSVIDKDTKMSHLKIYDEDDPYYSLEKTISSN